jgi:hypothetical protein
MGGNDIRQVSFMTFDMDENSSIGGDSAGNITLTANAGATDIFLHANAFGNFTAAPFTLQTDANSGIVTDGVGNMKLSGVTLNFDNRFGGTFIPSTSTGRILMYQSTGQVEYLPDGTTGQVLTMLSTSTLGWSTGSGGAFLPLAGGTMTGAINFSTSANSISDPNYSTLAIKSSTISLTAPGGYIYLNMFPSPASTFGMFLDSIAEIASDGAGNVDFVTTSLSIVGTFKQNQFILDNFGSAFGTTTQVAGPAIGTGGTHGITFLNSPNYSDCAGIIQAHVGTVPALGAVTRVTYGVAFPTGSFVVISPYNENAAALNSVTTVYVTSTTFDGFTLSTGTGALASGTIYQWTYHAIGF